MSSTYRLEAVEEREPIGAADAVGSLLAANLGWLAPVLVLLSGLNFRSVPSLTHGAVVFENATQRDARVPEFLSALDTVYADVRDGYELAHARGQILERFVWHVLEERFPERLGACRVLRDGADFRVHARRGYAP